MKRVSSPKQESALLLAAYTPDLPRSLAEHQVSELKSLALTAGAEVVRVCEQNLKTINPATYIGRGKLDELKQIISSDPFDVILMNKDLTPVQQRNLEAALKRRIVDRTELILDIFAQHAHSKDGKIQVELAQLRYLRPRLTGRGIDLSRLGGGIGTRGPGETQLEIDRRRIDQRIARLKTEWEKIRDSRRLQRKFRQRQNIATAVLVGYTNAGKSTLLNRLTSAHVPAQDQLFSTLDTTTRRLFLPNNRRLLLSDTVGFITDLPKPLLAAFRATLEVVEEADLLLHVVDAASPSLEEQFHAVHDVLHSLGCDEKPTLTVFNKCDRLVDDLCLRDLERAVTPNIRCSALRDPDLNPLRDSIADLLEKSVRKAPEHKNQDPISIIIGNDMHNPV
ncbi:MAG: GTPase HflX [Candidatus Omnitrophota bacterium]|nr:MAG: GTPase HflX [Candidatus Omnitrophota bacterium]